jgi:hypothetical protein
MSIAIFLDVLKKPMQFPREGKLDLIHVGVLWLVVLMRHHHVGCVDDISARLEFMRALRIYEGCGVWFCGIILGPMYDLAYERRP